MAAVSGHSFNIGPYGKNNEKSSCLKQLDQWGPDFVEIVLGWSPFIIVSVGLIGLSKMAAVSGHSFNIVTVWKKQ